MYQQLPNTPLGPSQCVKRIADNAFIPFDVQNIDYQAFLAWCAEGNTPIAADAAEPASDSVDQQGAE